MDISTRTSFPGSNCNFKVRVFITHGGAGSAQETICHKTPIVGIPINGDQVDNEESYPMLHVLSSAHQCGRGSEERGWFNGGLAQPGGRQPACLSAGGVGQPQVQGGRHQAVRPNHGHTSAPS